MSCNHKRITPKGNVVCCKSKQSKKYRDSACRKAGLSDAQCSEANRKIATHYAMQKNKKQRGGKNPIAHCPKYRKPPCTGDGKDPKNLRHKMNKYKRGRNCCYIPTLAERYQLRKKELGSEYTHVPSRRAKKVPKKRGRPRKKKVSDDVSLRSLWSSELEG